METREDNEVYAELQKLWFDNRDTNPKEAEKTLAKMYFIVKRYLARFERKYCRKNNLRMSKDQIEDDSTDMADWLISMYLTRPDWKGVDRMSAYAYNAFIKVMYNPKRIAREERIKELNEINKQRAMSTAIIQPYSEFNFETEEEKRSRWHVEKNGQGILDFGERE